MTGISQRVITSYASETNELLLCHNGPTVHHRQREMNSYTNPSKMQETS